MADPCIVDTSYGPVMGELRDGVRVWRGIPFAAATGGGRRFRKPEAPAGWEGVRDATAFGPMCPQVRSMEGRAAVSEMSEDCLTLNIWAPAADVAGQSAPLSPAGSGIQAAPSKSAADVAGQSAPSSPAADGGKRPVFFYIHGGTFVEGAGSDREYEGTNLALEGGVVVVTANYRVGAFGFLDFSFLDEGFSANCGLWDIIAALRWVNENIGAFGGDAGNVTVCGQSAGATCASILPMMAPAAGCLRRIIMMSGVPILLHTKDEAQRIARRYMDFMGIPDLDSLLGAPAEELAAGEKEFVRHCGLGSSTFAPCVDGEAVPGFPIRAALDGRMADIPMLIGVTHDEMSVVLKKSLSELLDVSEIRKMGTQAEEKDTAERIKGLYRQYGKRAPAVMMTDLVFHMPCVWLAEAYSRNSDTWMYRFDYATLGMRVSGLRSFHSSDVPFLFGNFKAGLARLMLLLSPVRKGVRRVHRELQGDFLEFAKTGRLPWEKCDGENAPAKCYALPPRVEQIEGEEARRAYDGSEIKRKSLAGEDIVNLREPQGKVACVDS